MRVVLIVNATASSVTDRARVVIAKALAADFDLAVTETSRRGHAERLARVAAVDGADVVVVMGGDGTLNEAANGLAGTQTALAPLPCGQTNVFARTLGISRDPLEATGQLLASLHRGSYRRIALGCVTPTAEGAAVDGRRFLFHAGLGFDAAVVARVETHHRALKRYINPSLWVGAAAVTWMRHYDRSRPRFALLAGDEIIEGCYMAIVSKTSPYTFLGSRPVIVAPDAGLDSPLSVTAFRTLRLAPFVGAIASALRSGSFLRRHPRIVHCSGLESVTVLGTAPFPYQVDGDHLGDAERLDFSYEPEALTVVVP